MAEEGESNNSPNIMESILMVIRAMRYILATLNLLVIIVTLYFLFSARNLIGTSLQMATWLRVIYCLLILATAIFGIVIAFWDGRKTKFHLKLIACYLIAVAVWAALGVILASIYVRKLDFGDYIFIGGTAFVCFLLTSSSLAFGYALKKTKTLRRAHAFTSIF